MADIASRDQNRNVTLQAVSSTDFISTVNLWADPITHALLVAISGSITIVEASPTTVLNGKTTVTTAGTRVVLASSTTIKSVTVKALSTNTGLIYVGNSTVSSSNGFQLSAGDSISMDIANLNTVNIDSSVNGEGVTYIAVN